MENAARGRGLGAPCAARKARPTPRAGVAFAGSGRGRGSGSWATVGARGMETFPLRALGMHWAERGRGEGGRSALCRGKLDRCYLRGEGQVRGVLSAPRSALLRGWVAAVGLKSPREAGVSGVRGGER